MPLSRLTRGSWVAVGAGTLAIACGTAFAGVQYVNRAELEDMTPAPGSAVATTRPLVAVAARHVVGMSNLAVTVDGTDATATVARTSDGRLVLPTDTLAEGPHDVTVRFSTRNVFSRTVERKWTFTVDTKLPALAITTPATGAEVNSRDVALTGTTDPNATVQVGWKGGSTDAVADANGAWTATAHVGEGASALQIVSRDAAGNAATATRRVVVDTRAPSMRLDTPRAKLTDTDAPVFTGTFSGETAGRAVVGATINGRTVLPLRGASGFNASGDPVAGVTFTDKAFALTVGRLPQGRNTVKVFVRDPAGNEASKTATIMVDSTEDFGSADLMPGARGADVKALQRQLKERGFKRTRVTGVYDAQTITSVKNYQRVHRMSQSGLFGPNTRIRFVGKIVVTLSKFRLQLVRDGKVVKTYKVAVGQPAFPTPTGTYRIVNKQRDPTWTPPPDSSWAKGLGPIPPGPGNPLGTRWMGTSAPFVGIHGTYADSSIGTRASHGCIRMHIKDVEALYELVAVGMPVELRA